MKLTDLVTPERAIRSLQAASKKRVLELISQQLAGPGSGFTKEELFDSLIGRERLGSTGLGKGVALPHGRVKGLEHALGCFVRLDKGVDFDAIDHRPVDLVFALLVPEHFTDEHLRILQMLATLFSDDALCAELRAAADDAELYRLLAAWEPPARPS